MASHKTVESLPCQINVVVDEADGADLSEEEKRLSSRRRGRLNVVGFFFFFFFFLFFFFVFLFLKFYIALDTAGGWQ